MGTRTYLPSVWSLGRGQRHGQDAHGTNHGQDARATDHGQDAHATDHGHDARATSHGQFARATWLVLAAVVGIGFVAGCGGGGLGGSALGGGGAGGDRDGGSSGGGPAQSVAAYRDDLTSDEAYHLLRRTSFGATPEQVAAAVERGLSATVDDLLTAKPISQELATMDIYLEEYVDRRWLAWMIESPNPLHERMALFWHDRFATSRRVANGGDGDLATIHWQMLRTHALGNYRPLLEALTVDPLMLIWLDGANSPKDMPDENYAREFWELFTLGRDVLYTESDIREAARAFTGITLLREHDQPARPIFDLLNHDETPKAIFPDRAAPANHDYLSVIDLTLQQPEAAQYVARNLFKLFVHNDPSDSTVHTLAQQFAAGGFEIAPLVRTILRSQAMFSEQARGSQIASPVEHYVSVARTLDMHVATEESRTQGLERLARNLRNAGQEVMNPPTVAGWDENEPWLQDQWIIARVDALGRTMEYGPDRTPDLPMHLLPPFEQWTERDVRGRMVDAIAAVFHLPLTEAEREIYIEVLDQDGWLAFHLENPEYQPRHVFEMIRLMAMDERVIGR